MCDQEYDQEYNRVDEKKSMAMKATKDEEMNKLLWDATEKAVGAKF